MKNFFCLVLLFLGLAASQGQVSYTPWMPIFKGIDRATGTNTMDYSGGPHIVQALRIDLQDPDVQIYATPPNTNNYVVNSRETLSQTPGNFLRANHLKVAINGAHYAGNTSYTAPDGTPEYLHGIAISKGQAVSPSDNYGEADSLMSFTSNNVVSFIASGPPSLYTTAEVNNYAADNGIYIAIPGIYSLVNNGVNVGYSYLGQGGLHAAQPRTAIGYSEDGRYLILLVIDGRQSDSNGAMDFETADWLIRFGAFNGMTLDGGGSTCMVMANDCGDPVTLNDPSIQYSFSPYRIGWQRSVGHNIGVFAKSLPSAFMQDPVITPGRTMAILQWNTASPASTQVEYGRTAALGTFSPLDSTPRTNHTVVLTGLAPNTSNYFRLISVAGVQYSTPVCSFLTLTNPPALVAPSNNMNQIFGVTQTWSYTSNNLDGVAWTARNYAETGWQGSGPGLLYVEDSIYVSPKNTALPTPCDPLQPGQLCTILPMTYYFRTHFNFPTNPANVTLSFTNWIDDGAVFYLNGVEINRVRMSPAPTQIFNNTRASGFTPTPYPNGDPHYGDAILDYPTVFSLSGAVVTNNLVQGDNVMAVEVHNYSPGSPDIVFGTVLNYTKSVIQATNSLVVMAADPNMAVPVSFSPSDNYGYGNGLTPCERLYYPTANPAVTAAPTNASGQVFVKWQLDGADYSNNSTVNVSMAASHVLVAVYGSPATIPTWTLAVNSTTPNSGVNIGVAPVDANTNGAGSTPFARNYTNGTTVTLTAPRDLGISQFLKWQRDGADYATNLVINVTVDTNRTFTAVYLPAVWTLSVNSTNAGAEVLIGVTPLDNGGLGDGATPFARLYTHGTLVSLIAPATAGLSVFQRWLKDGVDYSTNRVVSFNIAASQNLTAVYAIPRWTLSIVSSNPATNLAVDVQPGDVNGNTNGATPFARTYLSGTLVTVTAPAAVGSNLFVAWYLDGKSNSNQVVNVAMDANHTLSALYIAPLWTLAVNSLEPTNNVLVAIAPNDAQGNGDGATPVTRRYRNGSVVALTAPAASGLNAFQKWQSGGADLSTNQTLQVTVLTNTDVTAVYAVPRWTLSIGSSNPAVDLAVEVQPADVHGGTNGATPFARTYLSGTSVTVTAPAVIGTNQFVAWDLDGTVLSNLVVNVAMDTNHTLSAVYMTPLWTLAVSSLEPTNEVLVTIAPSDALGNGDGATPLTRRYHNGSVVALTASAQAGANSFEKWRSGGADLSTNLTLQLTLRTNTEVTAVYTLAVVVAPLLSFQRQDNSLVLNWTNAGYTLQAATNVAPLDWGDVAGPVTNGPYTNWLGEPAGFFRLRK